MKKRILSILLTVAMLVAMVPAIAVSAEETEPVADVVDEGNGVYTVNSIAGVNQFLADTSKNTNTNTMKLGVDLDYSNQTPSDSLAGFWTVLEADNKIVYLLANVDGNGHTVTVPGGSYKNGAILSYLTAKQGSYTIKNLTVKMAIDETTGEQEIASTTGASLALFGENGSNNTTASQVTFENCYFDVCLKTEYNSSQAGSAVLFGRHRASNKMQLTVRNCYFKAHIETKSGHHGALVGRRAGANADSTLTYNVNNCVFDISYTANSGKFTLGSEGYYCTAVVGCQSSYGIDDYAETEEVSDFSSCSNNLIYNNHVSGNDLQATEKGNLAGFTTIAAVDNPVTTVTGYQTTTVANNKFDLRLVGLVELGETALTDYSKVGFVVVANYANINTKWTSAASNKVYNSLSGTETDNTATGRTGIVSYEASDFGADYLYALAIKNIPANQGVITLEVTPYYIEADGTTVVYGATENVEIDPTTLADNTLANG